MEFENQYLTWDEYQELGGKISDETPFNLLEFKARKYVDKYTFGRLVNLENQSQEVKLCIFELINNLETYDKASSVSSEKAGIKSENIEGYSVSYADTTESMAEVVKGKEESCKDIIYNYLSNSALPDGTLYLYRGR